MVYREGDLAESMYIVQKGLASNLGRVMSSGTFFGEDMIAGSDENPSRRTSDVRSLTFLDVYEFSRENLYEILENGDFDETAAPERKNVITTDPLFHFLGAEYQPFMKRFSGYIAEHGPFARDSLMQRP